MRAFTLFATHYFELTHLPDECHTVTNVHLNATEHDDRIVFLHAVQDGPASQSYGLQVAQLAGVPRSVIQQARHKLTTLEAEESPSAPLSVPANTHSQMGLYAEPNPLADRLNDVSPDDLTPRQALELLYELKSLA